jgi:hypothetical protein
MARREIDRATRELASLLLHAGTSHALQAFAGELGDIADRVAQLRGSAIAHATPNGNDVAAAARNLSAEQRRVADMLQRVIKDVGNLEEVTTEALAAVRLARVRKEVERADVIKRLNGAADSLAESRFSDAAQAQGEAVQVLLSAIDRLRPDARLETLVRLRNHIRQLISDQRDVREVIEQLDADQFSSRYEELARRQKALVDPLRELSSAPELDDLRRQTQAEMLEARGHLAGQNRDRALTAQREVGQTLAKMAEMLDERIAEYQQLQQAYRKLQQANRRVRQLRDMEARQAQIIDDTDALELAGKDVTHLAAAQEAMDAQRRRMIESLDMENRWSDALARPLKRAERFMTDGTGKLEANKAIQATRTLLKSLSLISEAEDIADREMAYLDEIWSLSQLASDLEELTRYTEDLQAEQADLARIVAQAEESGQSVLDSVSTQQVLSSALGELEEILDMVPEAASVTIPLFDARSEMGQAMSALEEDNATRALPHLTAAAKALEAAGSRAKDVAKRTEYLTQLAEQFEQYSAMAANLLQRQIDLREETELAEEDKFDPLAEEQDVLRGEAQTFGDMMPVASQHYKLASDEMGKAIENLYLAQREVAVVHQKKAEEHLKNATKEIWVWLESMQQMMEQLEMEPVEWPSGMDPISKLLLLSIQENELRMTMMGAAPDRLERFVEFQQEILTGTEEVETLIEEAEYAMLDTGKQAFAKAKGRMNDAMAAMKEPDKPGAIEHARQAERALRQVMAELIVFTFPVPAEEEELEEEEGEPEPPLSEPPPPMDPQGRDWSVFLKATPRGKAAEKGRAEWQELTERDREALHENFARELPLEYRQVLRDYYKALAQ